MAQCGERRDYFIPSARGEEQRSETAGPTSGAQTSDALLSTAHYTASLFMAPAAPPELPGQSNYVTGGCGTRRRNMGLCP